MKETECVFPNKLTYPLIPSSVLLAKSTRPPAGRAITPTTPLPRPLKNPAAPCSFAPGTSVERNKGSYM